MIGRRGPSGYGHSVKFWHVRTRRELLSLDYRNATDGIAISPDGRWIAVTLGEHGNTQLELLEAPVAEPFTNR